MWISSSRIWEIWEIWQQKPKNLSLQQLNQTPSRMLFFCHQVSLAICLQYELPTYCSRQCLSRTWDNDSDPATNWEDIPPAQTSIRPPPAAANSNVSSNAIDVMKKGMPRVWRRLNKTNNLQTQGFSMHKHSILCELRHIQPWHFLLSYPQT